MTPELRDDLIKFSFNDLQEVLSTDLDASYSILYFIPVFLSSLEKLV
jgi:hypothetical protein